MKLICKLRLEKYPHDYGSKDIEQILQSLVKRKTELHRQCYQHFTNQNKLDRLLSNQPKECVSETESVVKGGFKSQDKRLFSGKRPTNHFFFRIIQSYYLKQFFDHLA